MEVWGREQPQKEYLSNKNPRRDLLHPRVRVSKTTGKYSDVKVQTPRRSSESVLEKGMFSDNNLKLNYRANSNHPRSPWKLQNQRLLDSMPDNGIQASKSSFSLMDGHELPLLQRRRYRNSLGAAGNDQSKTSSKHIFTPLKRTSYFSPYSAFEEKAPRREKRWSNPLCMAFHCKGLEGDRLKWFLCGNDKCG